MYLYVRKTRQEMLEVEVDLGSSYIHIQRRGFLKTPYLSPLSRPSVDIQSISFPILFQYHHHRNYNNINPNAFAFGASRGHSFHSKCNHI